ncbi:MAG TPA: hypothetical protein VL326_20815 [Kofleriaceae bacterium]|nr:hypothetical protein [Kofleriaceae bacterium]
MKRILLLASPLISLAGAGCYGGERYNTGECPAGETCSDLTPKGLQFVGNHLVDDILLSGPRATAVDGTQVVALQYDRGDGITVALDLPYTADDDGGNGVKVSATSGSQVTMLGAGSRTNYLRILDQDGLLMDRKELTGAALTKIELVPTDFESIPNGSDLAFAPGKRELGVALYGDVQHSSGPVSERIVDTGMQLTLAGSTLKAWDTLELANAQVGRSTLLVGAGDKKATPANIEIVVVDHADAVSAIDPAPTAIMPSGSQQVCFKATMADTNGPRYITGLTWNFNVDGTTKTQGDGTVTRNCISFSTTKTTGTVSVQATAGGQSATVTLAVGAARSIAPVGAGVHTAADAVPTDGDRAAL